jgi:putative transcriptional regulator
MSDSLTGKLLIATPSLLDPNFRRTVVLMCAHGEQGAFGLVLNRPLDVAPVSEHLPVWQQYIASPEVVFKGGPVQPEVAFGLARSSTTDPAPGWQPLTAGVGLVDLGTSPDDALFDVQAMRIFAGYAGWVAGQLEGEIAEGAWFVLDPDPQDPFSTDPQRLWRDILHRQADGKTAMFAFFPDDPRLN